MIKDLSKGQTAVYLIECYLQENYEFRHNVLSGMVEFRQISDDDQTDVWMVVTAKVMYEIVVSQTPYWFTNAEEERIQQMNQPYMKEESLENMLSFFYKVPLGEEKGEWLTLGQVIESMQGTYPKLKNDQSTRIKVGLALRQMGCVAKETNRGIKYQLIELEAA